MYEPCISETNGFRWREPGLSKGKQQGRSSVCQMKMLLIHEAFNPGETFLWPSVSYGDLIYDQSFIQALLLRSLFFEFR